MYQNFRLTSTLASSSTLGATMLTTPLPFQAFSPRGWVMVLVLLIMSSQSNEAEAAPPTSCSSGQATLLPPPMTISNPRTQTLPDLTGPGGTWLSHTHPRGQVPGRRSTSTTWLKQTSTRSTLPRLPSWQGHSATMSTLGVRRHTVTMARRASASCGTTTGF